MDLVVWNKHSWFDLIWLRYIRMNRWTYFTQMACALASRPSSISIISLRQWWRMKIKLHIHKSHLGAKKEEQPQWHQALGCLVRHARRRRIPLYSLNHMTDTFAALRPTVSAKHFSSQRMMPKIGPDTSDDVQRKTDFNHVHVYYTYIWAQHSPAGCQHHAVIHIREITPCHLEVFCSWRRRKRTCPQDLPTVHARRAKKSWGRTYETCYKRFVIVK